MEELEDPLLELSRTGALLAKGVVSGGTGKAATAVSRSLHGQLAGVPNCLRRHSPHLHVLPMSV